MQIKSELRRRGGLAAIGVASGFVVLMVFSRAIPVRSNDTSAGATQGAAPEQARTTQEDVDPPGIESANDPVAEGSREAIRPPLAMESDSDAVDRRELSLLEDKLYELFAAHVNGITSIESVKCTEKLCESTYTATREGHREVGELIPLFLTEMGAPSSNIRRVEISPGAYKYVLRLTFP